jgi:hypothetical protein
MVASETEVKQWTKVMPWPESPQVLRLIEGSSMTHWGPWFAHKVSVAQRKSERAAEARDSRSAPIRACIRSAAEGLSLEHRSWVEVVDKRLHRRPTLHGVPQDEAGKWLFPNAQTLRLERDALCGRPERKRARGQRTQFVASISKPSPAVWFAAYASTSSTT